MIQTQEDLPLFAQNLYGLFFPPPPLSFEPRAWDRTLMGRFLASRKLPKNKTSCWRSWMRMDRDLRDLCQWKDKVIPSNSRKRDFFNTPTFYHYLQPHSFNVILRYRYNA